MKKNYTFVFISIIMIIACFGRTFQAKTVYYSKNYKLCKKIIRKCEKIKNPVKKEKCQKRFLSYFNLPYGEMASILRELDPMEWELVFRYFTKTDRRINLRIIAFDHLNDQDGLANIVISDHLSYGKFTPYGGKVKLKKTSLKERESAFKLIKGEEYLKKIFNQCKISYLKDWALQNIHDQEFLITLIKKDNPSKYTAVRKLEDLEVLEDLASNDPDGHVREIAVAKVKDQKLLQNLIKNDSYLGVKRYAMINIDPVQSRDFLKGFVDSPYRHVRRIARLKLIISDPKIRSSHGKLELQYENPYRPGKTYSTMGGFKKFYVDREVIIITITKETGEVIFDKAYWGREPQKTELFKLNEMSKEFKATIDFDAIREILMKK